MKIVDEKGRLFGKINIIDFLVILFLLCFIPMFFYLGYKISKKPLPVEWPREFSELELDFRLTKVKQEVLKLIKVGDKEIDNNGKVIGEIISIGKSSSFRNVFDLGKNFLLTKEDPTLMDLLVRLRLWFEIKDSNLYYKDRAVKIDEIIYFRTEKYTVAMTPVMYFKEVADANEINLNVNFKELDEDTLRLISKGDKMLNERREVIAEILDLGEVEDNIYRINLTEGFFAVGKNNAKKQINATIRLKCAIGNDSKLYFNNQRIVQDSLIEFRTDKYTIKGTVSEKFGISIPNFNEKRVSIKINFAEVIPDLSKIINEGDIEKDSSGRTVAILRKILNSGYSKVLVLKDKEFIVVGHPFNKDILVSLGCLCIEKGGVLYFKNYPVKIGNTINFSTELYSINGTILELEY